MTIQKSKAIVKLFGFCVITIIGVIINSCRKDAKTQPLPDAALNQAKTWYESTYPAPGNTRMLITRSTRPAVLNGNFDFSQYIKPDWNHAKKYRRLGKDVIELPVDPSGKLSSAIKNQTTGKILNTKENSHNSFVLLNDGKNYQAYVMTLLADSAYAKNHPAWASANTYQKRDPDFSGLVLYFTPKGQYVNGYAFRNGNQVIPKVQNTTTSATAKGQLTRSFRPRVQVEAVYDCTFYYILELDNFGNVISQTFFYADCTSEPNTDQSGGGGGDGGTPSAAVPPPPPCQPSGPPSELVNNHSLTRVTQPPPDGGDDGGMPPPQPCPEVIAVPQTDIVTDPCGQAKTLSAIATYVNFLKNLESNIGTNYEVDYTYTDPSNANTYTYEQGNANETFDDYNVIGQIAGSMHDHSSGMVDSNGNPIILSPVPTPDDFASIWTLYNNKNMSNPATFTETVITAQSTAYMITITDVSKFKAWAATNLTANSAGVTQFYTNAANSGNNYLKLGYSNLAAHELALLDNLTDSGLTLLRGDYTNLNTWSPITSNTGAVVVTPCP